MNITRIISSLILFPIVALIVIFGNTYIIDIAVAVIAIMSLHEFYKAFSSNGRAKPISWIGYLAAAIIAIIHIVPMNFILKMIGAILPIAILILFSYTIISNGKRNIIDVAVTFFGICYIAIFLMFIPIIMENIPNGRLMIWFVFFAAWGTDIFAYVIGKNFGKHKFTQISPHKTIEGCIGGTIGATILVILLAVVFNNFWNANINYIYIAFVGVVLSLVSQIGDLSASAIKRYTGIKDFSNLIPGHGGMLDRIDSIVFIAPFAYFLLLLV